MLALATPPPPPPPPPARILAFADEFRFTVSRASVPAGPVRLQLRNVGEDDHDLRILGPRGGVRAETGIVEPGEVGEIRVRLTRGRHVLVCTVAGHAAHGMTARLLVTPRKRPPRR